MAAFLILCAIAYWVGSHHSIIHRVPASQVAPWECSEDGGITVVYKLESGAFRIHCADGRLILTSTGGW